MSRLEASIDHLVSVTCDYAEHSFVLSFAALRRLRFGGGERDAAARSLIAALGLVALAEQDARGYALRSRCDLVCDENAPLAIVHPDGKTDDMMIDRHSARAIYREAYKAARDAGFAFSNKPLRLAPQDKLIEIVRRSQHLALSGEGGDEEGSGNGE